LAQPHFVGFCTKYLFLLIFSAIAATNVPCPRERWMGSG
jgi:hypothetical protein